MDGALRAAFEPGESVLARLQRSTGVTSRILLHDPPQDESPLLRVGGAGGPGADDDGRYRIVGEIAKGGVGVVYKARDIDLGRDVALKVLRREHASNPQVLERLVEEAQIGGQLQHPGIVPVYGMGLWGDGRPSFAMKLIKGRTLAAMLHEREDPSSDLPRFLRVFEQICQTIAYAHTRGVIHRDLKPSNVMVGGFGEVLVVDWGFGKVLGREDPLAQRTAERTIVATVRSKGEGSDSVAGSVMGTPAYMPPEQALGQVETLDERCDVFALGAILCEILTGAPAYVGAPEDLLVMAAQARLDGAHERL
jgi:serine/threonine-protein kinase